MSYSSATLFLLVFQLELLVLVRMDLPVVLVPVVGVLEGLGTEQASVRPLPTVYVHVVPVAGLALEPFAADATHVPLQVVGSVGHPHVVLESLGVELFTAVVASHLGWRVYFFHVQLVSFVVLKR